MEESIIHTQNKLFLNLLPSEKQKIIELGKKYFFKKDQYIFHAHNPIKSIYLLTNGHAKVFHVSETGKEVILWFCMPGEVFGLAECLSGDQRKVYAQACSDVTVAAVPEVEFNSFIASNNKLAFEVIQLLSHRLRILSKTLLSVSTDDAETKIKHIINRLSQCYGVIDQDTTIIDFYITHQEIADMIGTSRQTVTTTINQFKRQNLLFVKHRKIHLYNAHWNKSSNNYSETKVNELIASTVG